jgi:hypothetical protein
MRTVEAIKWRAVEPLFGGLRGAMALLGEAQNWFGSAVLLTAERKFWRCVQTGEPPRLFGVEPPRPRIEPVRIVDMSSSNSWAEFASVFRRTRDGYLEHDNARAELKRLMPEDAREAIGHGIRAKRSKSGAVNFDLLA